jgi:hypothetical protein
MRWRKILISVLLASIVILDANGLGWSVVTDETTAIATYVLDLFFAIYLLIINTRSINHVANNHWITVIHVTSLTTIACMFLGTISILPSTSPIAVNLDDNPVLRAMFYVKLGLYFAVCILAFMTPLGPPLHYPPSGIYSEKTVESITNKDEEIVCGLTGALFLGLYFTST